MKKHGCIEHDQMNQKGISTSSLPGNSKGGPDCQNIIDLLLDLFQKEFTLFNEKAVDYYCMEMSKLLVSETDKLYHFGNK